MSFRFHTLRQEQWIARPLDEVFRFFADPNNLEVITPPWLGFQILSADSRTIGSVRKARNPRPHRRGWSETLLSSRVRQRAGKMSSFHADSIAEGTEIRYRLHLHRIPIYWRTEIRQWNPPHRFVDVQKSGPYRLWHHTHRFEAHGDCTRMIDIVRYTLPFGFLGRIVHKLKVRGDVRRIFDYRRQRIHELFSEHPAVAS